MIPLYISGCFGVLHPGCGKRGALIYGPVSDEALNSYRSLVFLAEQLAAADIPTLRLAYYGTGDSAGDDDEPDRFGQWLRSIDAGVAWLREHCGVELVTLIGHRIGASLASWAACDIDAVDSLVLSSPIDGRQLLHEMTLAARISRRVWQTTHKIDDGTWFESHGLRVSRATLDALNMLDIRKLTTRPAAQALVLDAESRPAVLAVVEALQGIGTETMFEACGSLNRMQRDSHIAEVPHAAFDRIVRWVQSLPAAPDASSMADPDGDASVDVGPARETPIRFGPDTTLFGILSLPSRPSPHAPAVLLLNTSANPRWGNARIAVDLARGLAADGVVSLRMDASGMGDAAPRTGEIGRPYAEATTADVLQGVAELVLRTQQPVVVLGVCSGAYHALQAAYRDVRVGGLVLVNLQRFVWREGDPSDIVRRSDLRPTRFYLQNILNAQAWLRLLRADFDVANLVRVLATRLLRRALAGIDPLLNGLPGGVTRVGRVRRAMQALGNRRMPILYVLGCNDPGIEELAEYFGRDGWRLRRQPNVTMRLLEGADHTLGAHKLRTALIDDIRDWCRDNWLARGSSNQRSVAQQPHIRCGTIDCSSGTAPLQTAGQARTVMPEHYRDWTSTASRS
jgi:alpha-beta hydrolase superfamily lysophospholipase